jgi:hypothetical protein
VNVLAYVHACKFRWRFKLVVMGHLRGNLMFLLGCLMWFNVDAILSWNNDVVGITV